jgi:hypothetical protein
MHEGLFRSSSHRVNLLGDAFDEAGVDILSGPFQYEGKDLAAHLATMKSARSAATPGPQHLRYRNLLLPRMGARIHFRSRLGWASPSQTARVEVSADGGHTWISVFSQPGTDTPTFFRVRLHGQ